MDQYIVGNFEKSNKLQSKMQDRIDFLEGIKNVLEGNSIDGYAYFNQIELPMQDILKPKH